MASTNFTGKEGKRLFALTFSSGARYIYLGNNPKRVKDYHLDVNNCMETPKVFPVRSLRAFREVLIDGRCISTMAEVRKVINNASDFRQGVALIGSTLGY